MENKTDHLIVKTVTRFLMPFIQVYGIFIILHGHLSPGGGFSGGTILGSSMILYTLSFSLEKTVKKISHKASARFEAGGILLVVLLGFSSILAGSSFLSNQEAGFWMGTLGNIWSGGIIPLISIAIGIKVASTIITLFHTILEENSSELIENNDR